LTERFIILHKVLKNGSFIACQEVRSVQFDEFLRIGLLLSVLLFFQNFFNALLE